MCCWSLCGSGISIVVVATLRLLVAAVQAVVVVSVIATTRSLVEARREVTSRIVLVVWTLSFGEASSDSPTGSLLFSHSYNAGGGKKKGGHANKTGGGKSLSSKQ